MFQRVSGRWTATFCRVVGILWHSLCKKKQSRPCGPRRVLGGGRDAINPRQDFCSAGGTNCQQSWARSYQRGNLRKRRRIPNQYPLMNWLLKNQKPIRRKCPDGKTDKTVFGRPSLVACFGNKHEARAPLTHLSHFLHQKRQGQFNHVAILCTGKASTIFDEFSEVWLSLWNLDVWWGQMMNRNLSAILRSLPIDFSFWLP